MKIRGLVNAGHSTRGEASLDKDFSRTRPRTDGHVVSVDGDELGISGGENGIHLLPITVRELGDVGDGQNDAVTEGNLGRDWRGVPPEGSALP